MDRLNVINLSISDAFGSIIIEPKRNINTDAESMLHNNQSIGKHVSQKNGIIRRNTRKQSKLEKEEHKKKTILTSGSSRQRARLPRVPDEPIPCPDLEHAGQRSH